MMIMMTIMMFRRIVRSGSQASSGAYTSLVTDSGADTPEHSRVSRTGDDDNDDDDNDDDNDNDDKFKIGKT